MRISRYFPALFLLAACGRAPSLSTAKAEEGGVLSILVIPPAQPLDWSSPKSLIETSALSKIRGEWDILTGKVKSAHPIGHLMVELACGDVSIQHLGQTGAGGELASALDGLGASFRRFPGFLDDPAAVEPDLALRRRNGKIAAMRFNVNGAVCHQVAAFLAEYRARGADQNYGGQYRPRRFEGAGCSSFALAFLEVGGVLKRSQFTPAFARDVQIGIGRLADFQGSGSFDFGSNLVGHDADGKFVAWPKGAPLRVQGDAISPTSNWLDAWADDRDASTNVAADVQPNAVPWTIYDPQLIWDFIHTTAAAGGGEALGRTWRANTEEGAVVLETDAIDAVPQDFVDQQDDLRVD